MRSSHADKWGGPAYRRVSGRTSPAPHIARRAAVELLRLCRHLIKAVIMAVAAAWTYWQRCSVAQRRRAALAAAVLSLVLTLMLSGPMVNVEPGQGDTAVTSSWLARWSRSWQRQPPPLQPCIPPDRATPWEVALALQPSSTDAGNSSQLHAGQAEASAAQPDAGQQEQEQQQQQQQGQVTEAAGQHHKRLVRAYYPQQQRATLAPDGQLSPTARGWQLVPPGRLQPVKQGAAVAIPAAEPAAAGGLPSRHAGQQQLRSPSPQTRVEQQTASLTVQDERGTSVQAAGGEQPHGRRPPAHGLPHARHIAQDTHPSQEAEHQPVHQQQQEQSTEQQDSAEQTGSDQQQPAAEAEHQEHPELQAAVSQQQAEAQQQLPDQQQQQEEEEGQESLQQADGAAADAAASLQQHHRSQHQGSSGGEPAAMRSGQESAAAEGQEQQQQPEEGGGQQLEEGKQQQGGQQQVQDVLTEQQRQQQLEQLQRLAQQERQQAAASPAAAAAVQTTVGHPRPLTPVELAAAVRGFQVAVVNDVVFHHEVTLGVVSALQKHQDRLLVYVHPSVLQPTPGSLSFGLREYIEQRLPGTQLRDAHHKEGIRLVDVAIFISPEYSVDYYRSFIAASKPRFVIIFVHEPTSSVKRLRYLITMHRLVASVTLSPHVADVVTEAMKGMFTHWMMPTLPAGCNNTCWEGAALQGKFEGSRRNYAGLWQDLLTARDAQQQAQQQQAEEGVGGGGVSQQDHRRALLSSISSLGAYSSSSSSGSGSLRCGQHASWHAPAAPAATSTLRKLLRSTPRDPALLQAAEGSSNDTQAAPLVLTPAGALGAAVEGVPLVNVLGSGNPAALEVPEALWRAVRLYRHLNFADYYDTLCRSALMLPLFNISSRYLTDKISSSVLASLATGAPLVVPRRFLEVYTPFREEHVVLLEEGESESAALHRLIQGGAAASAHLAATRAALGRLAAHLNIQATAKLDGIMTGGVGQPHSGPKQP